MLNLTSHKYSAKNLWHIDKKSVQFYTNGKRFPEDEVTKYHETDLLHVVVPNNLFIPRNVITPTLNRIFKRSPFNLSTF